MSEHTAVPSMYAEYELDTTAAEKDGTWVTFKGGVEICLLAESSTIGRKWAHKRIRSLRAVVMQNDGVLPPEVTDKNDIDLLAECLVVNWRGVVDRNGDALPCTPHHMRQIFTQLPALRRDVLSATRMDETFRKAALDAMVGNSEPSSPPS